jgi:hypothetical protein
MAGGGPHSVASGVSRFNTDTVVVLPCPEMSQTRPPRPRELAWDLRETGTEIGSMSLAGPRTAPDSPRWAEPLVAHHVTGPKD